MTKTQLKAYIDAIAQKNSCGKNELKDLLLTVEQQWVNISQLHW